METSMVSTLRFYFFLDKRIRLIDYNDDRYTTFTVLYIV